MAGAAKRTRTPGQRAGRRGASLLEALTAVVILAFAVASAATLYNTAVRQQRLARGYSDAQSEIRRALREASRAIRHGSAVKNPSAQPNFPAGALNSTASQAIVQVQENGANIELRFYVANSTLFYQRSDSTTSTALLTGVQSENGGGALVFRYFLTSGSVRTDVTSTSPQSANQVEITLTATRNGIFTSAATLANLRNAVAAIGTT